MSLRLGTYGPDGRWHDAVTGRSGRVIHDSDEFGMDLAEDVEESEERPVWVTQAASAMRQTVISRAAILRGPTWPR